MACLLLDRLAAAKRLRFAPLKPETEGWPT